MPHIVVKMSPGRSEQQKLELAGKIVKDVVDVLHCEEDAISLTIEDVEPDDWMEMVYKPDIQDKWDKLYKKPGYKP